MTARVKPPLWFWIVATVLLLWSLIGVIGFHVDLATTPAMRARLDAYDQQLYATRPAWFMPVYGVAVWTGLIGSVALLARRGKARMLYILSLVAVVIMFGWMFVATGIIAHKGVLIATGLPIVIAVLAAAEIGFAGRARRRGWIG